ncbi:hypothetical protein CFP56_002613 [Quercus suber]|uniref:Uncharacterized protein n=1 Tax=Quercus suber TaxID=58331 RepID=A0AAW0IJR9_QUESU
METSYTMNNRAPIKEIALAVSLLVFGTLGIIIGIFMAINHIGGDRATVCSLQYWVRSCSFRVHILNFSRHMLVCEVPMSKQGSQGIISEVNCSVLGEIYPIFCVELVSMGYVCHKMKPV